MQNIFKTIWHELKGVKKKELIGKIGILDIIDIYIILISLMFYMTSLFLYNIIIFNYICGYSVIACIINMIFKKNDKYKVVLIGEYVVYYVGFLFTYFDGVNPFIFFLIALIIRLHVVNNKNVVKLRFKRNIIFIIILGIILLGLYINFEIQLSSPTTDPSSNISYASNSSSDNSTTSTSDDSNSSSDNSNNSTTTSSPEQQRQAVLSNFLGDLTMQKVNLNASGNNVGGNMGAELYKCVDSEGNTQKQVLIIDTKGTKSAMVAQFLILAGNSISEMDNYDTLYLMNANGEQTDTYIETTANPGGKSNIDDFHIQSDYQATFQTVENKLGKIFK